MPFHDFEIRAWVVGRTQAAVVVHSSPAGAMQRPETVSLDRNRLSPFLDIFAGSSKIETEVIVGLVAAGGRELGSILFPEQVIGMLIRSLERIDPECGLRVRLCLDSELSDLPWEYLILPQAAGLKAPGGFLALDARVSLVREPPQPGKERPRLQKKQRLLFFGTRYCYSDGIDRFECAKERDTLLNALDPAASFLDAKAVLSNETDCQTALMRSKTSIDIFHYSGHVDVENGNGYLIAGDLDAISHKSQRLYASTLGPLLRRAGTTIAVFSCVIRRHRFTVVEPQIVLAHAA